MPLKLAFPSCVYSHLGGFGIRICSSTGSSSIPLCHTLLKYYQVYRTFVKLIEFIDFKFIEIMKYPSSLLKLCYTFLKYYRCFNLWGTDRDGKREKIRQRMHVEQVFLTCSGKKIPRVCVYVCVVLCMCGCMCVCMLGSMYVCMYVCSPRYMYVCMQRYQDLP